MSAAWKFHQPKFRMFNLCEPFGAGNVLSDVLFDFGREHGAPVGHRISETPMLWHPQTPNLDKHTEAEVVGNSFKGAAKRIVWNRHCDPYTAQEYQGSDYPSWGFNNFAPEMHAAHTNTRIRYYRVWGVHFGTFYKYKALELVISECERLYAQGDTKRLHGVHPMEIVELDTLDLLKELRKFGGEAAGEK